MNVNRSIIVFLILVVVVVLLFLLSGCRYGIADVTVSDEVVIAFISAAVLALLTTVGVLWKIILNIAAENRAERERLRKQAEEAEKKGDKHD